MNEDDKLRANVRAELARARVSAAEMDRRLGWSRATVSRRLLGDAEFRASDLSAIARELGIPVGRFYDADAPAPRSASDVPAPAVDAL